MVGEHIRTLREGRWNHAIDCGDETVIHLAQGDGAPRLCRRYRPEFVAGAEAVETVTHRERTFPPGEVVARAYSRFADPSLAAMFRDSEAFAAWCETGRLPPGPPNVAVAPVHAEASSPAVVARSGTAAARPRTEPKPAPRSKPKRPQAKVAMQAKPSRRGSTSARRAGPAPKKAKAKTRASAKRPAQPAKRRAAVRRGAKR